jgi:hypothetical protein
MFLVDEYVEGNIYSAGKFLEALKNQELPTTETIDEESLVWSDPDKDEFILGAFPEEDEEEEEEEEEYIGTDSNGFYTYDGRQKHYGM